MAAAAASQVKQLGQILKEQQEPFTLETYLLEKGCFNENPNLLEKQQVRLGCFNGKKKHSRKKRVHKFVRVLFHHIASIHKRGKSSETLQAERLSFDSSSTTLNWASFSDDAQEEENRESCSSSSGNKCFYQHLEFCNPNDEKKQQEINGLGLQLHCMEDQNQQFSPDSVLEGFTSSTHEEASSPANSSSFFVSGNVSYEVILRSAKPQRPNSGVDTSTQQLVFDCIAEMVEMAHGSSRKRKLWCTSERILRSWSWRKGKPFHNSELCNASVIIDEWSDDEQRREIGLEIEDLIFKEMKDEIMVDLIGKQQ
ncbi:hypothetical protein LINGRAHAP2_LOCUS23865 [Linum grandiflorum]